MTRQRFLTNCLLKAWQLLSIGYRSYDSLIYPIKLKRNLFQAVEILPYRCTTWMQTKRIEKKLDGNDTRMIQAVSNKLWKQHHKNELYGLLPSISKTIQIKRTRHAGHFWINREELLWRSFIDVPMLAYLQDFIYLNFCADTGCTLKDLIVAMKDRDKERVKEIRSVNTTWVYNK